MQSPKVQFVVLRFRSFIWLFFALTIVVLTIVLWMYAKANISTETKESVPEKNVVTVKDININKRIEHLEDLETDVAPIKFETVVRDMRNYPDEFIDQNFLTKNTDKWTLKIMDVGAHETITDYLQQRKDRDKFYYFRYTDNNNQLRYVLIYDLVGQLDDAIELIQNTDFNLPKSVKIEPEEVNRFISIIDNYERAEAVLDMSTTRPRSIILRKTNREVPVRRVIRKPKPKPSHKSSGNKLKNSIKPKKKSENTSQKQSNVKEKPTKEKAKSNSSNKPVKKVVQKPVTKQKPIANQERAKTVKKSEPKPKPFVPNSPP